eukprot:15482315-Alexandrium_andersonii.AAC.1
MANLSGRDRPTQQLTIQGTVGRLACAFGSGGMASGGRADRQAGRAGALAIPSRCDRPNSNLPSTLVSDPHPPTARCVLESRCQAGVAI